MENRNRVSDNSRQRREREREREREWERESSVVQFRFNNTNIANAQRLSSSPLNFPNVPTCAPHIAPETTRWIQHHGELSRRCSTRYKDHLVPAPFSDCISRAPWTTTNSYKTRKEPHICQWTQQSELQNSLFTRRRYFVSSWAVMNARAFNSMR